MPASIFLSVSGVQNPYKCWCRALFIKDVKLQKQHLAVFYKIGVPEDKKNFWKIPMKEFTFSEICKLKNWTFILGFFKDFSKIVCCLPLHLKFSAAIFCNTSQLHSFYFRKRSIAWQFLFFYCLQNLLKRTLPHTHL